MSQGKIAKASERFIAKMKQQAGQFGNFYKVLLNNPSPMNKDGSPNTYYKGHLLWFDATTGKYYQVLQMSVKGVTQKDLANGYVQSLSIDLDDKYQVVPVQS